MVDPVNPFLHLSVSHSVHREGVWRTPPQADTHPPQEDTPWADTPQADTTSGQTPPALCMLGYTPRPGGHCSGRYASYWNAFCFEQEFPKDSTTHKKPPKKQWQITSHFMPHVDTIRSSVISFMDLLPNELISVQSVPKLVNLLHCNLSALN